MRITHNFQASAFSHQNQQSMEKIAHLQQQISSAKRILSPSDDPAATGKSIVLNQSLGQVAQYERNNTYAESRLGMEESVIGSMSDVLIGIRELALQANNDSMGDADRQAILQGITARKEELLSLANSRGPNGEFLFSGTERNVQPYPDPDNIQYQGNNSYQLVNIGISNQIALGTSGEALFDFELNGSVKSAFTTITDIQNTLATPVTVAGRPAFHQQMGEFIAELDEAQNHINTERANVGTRMSRIDTARNNNSSVELMLREELENTEGLDYADAISRMESELQTLEAIQSTYSRLKDLSLFNYL